MVNANRFNPRQVSPFGKPRQLRQLRDILFCLLKRACSCFGYKDEWICLVNPVTRVILHLGCSPYAAAMIRSDRNMGRGEGDIEIPNRLIFFTWYPEDARKGSLRGIAYMSNSMTPIEISGGVHKASTPETYIRKPKDHADCNHLRGACSSDRIHYSMCLHLWPSHIEYAHR